jgi:hypothetical protein
MKKAKAMSGNMISMCTFSIGIGTLLALSSSFAAPPAVEPPYEIVMDANGMPQLRAVLSCEEFKSGDGAKTAVLFTFGQSNGGNEGGAPFIARSGVGNLDFRTGRCYNAQDPLIGATGLKGSPWTLLGEKLVGRGMYGKVLLVPISVSSSSVSEWAVGGVFHPRLLQALDQLRQTGIEVSAFLWHQGEAESHANYVPGKYTRDFRTIANAIREHGFQAPIYVAKATICTADNDDMEAPDPHDYSPELTTRVAGGQYAFRREVAKLPDIIPGVLAGPDTDLINPALRWDECHFGDGGQDAHAEAWFTTLTGKVWSKVEGNNYQIIAIYSPKGDFELAQTFGRLSLENCLKWVRWSLMRAKQQKFTMHGEIAYSRSADAPIVRPVCIGIDNLKNGPDYDKLRHEHPFREQ